jgi:hypothetical protein
MISLLSPHYASYTRGIYTSVTPMVPTVSPYESKLHGFPLGFDDLKAKRYFIQNHSWELPYKSPSRIIEGISIVDKHSTEKIREEFANLAFQWIQQVQGGSSTVEMSKHPAYQKIINLGRDVIPFLLQDLCQNPIYWIPVLRQITQENPVLPEQRGKIKQMAEAWLDWGRQNGYSV